MRPDAIVVGAGYSGAIMAERIASQMGRRVLLLEQRDHIAGNCHDERDSHGVLIHRYGPHLFHTRHRKVWEYLSRFTRWRPYEHKVLASIDESLLPIPFNLNSIDAAFAPEKSEILNEKLLSRFAEGSKVPILELLKEEDEDLKELADFIYEKVFVNYTTKQWGCSPEDISPEVLARVPVLVGRDDRYFQDPYQAVPEEGYSRMFAAMLDHPLIDLQLNMRAEDRLQLLAEEGKLFFDGEKFDGLLVYTGMLDALFGFCFGELPYRSLRFEFEHLQQDVFQPTGTVNYPNHPHMTRITEFKHITGQQHVGTTVVREYPQDYDRAVEAKNVPYYPLFTQENTEKHNKYKKLEGKFNNLISLGRLADYKYYNMDDAALNALELFESRVQNFWSG